MELGPHPSGAAPHVYKCFLQKGGKFLRLHGFMSKYTAFRCPLDIHEAAKKKAKAERRSLSNYIIRLLEEATADELKKVRAVKGSKRR